MSPIRLAAGVAVVTAGLFVPAALSDPPKPVPAAPVTPSELGPKDDAGLRCKVIRLERADPAALVRDCAELLGPSVTALDVPARPGRGVGANFLGGGAFGGGFGANIGGALGGALNQAGVNLGAAGRGFDDDGRKFGVGGGFAAKGACVRVGFGGDPGQNPRGPVGRAVEVNVGRAVVVRGSEQHLAAATELAAVLDRVPGSPVPTLKVIRAVPLARLMAETAMNAVGNLEFAGLGAVAPGDDKLLLLFGPDKSVRAAAAVVAELDALPPDKE